MADKTRCNNNWTESRFNSFIKSTLRRASMRWAPINTCKVEARHYEKLLNAKGRKVFHSICAICGDITPETLCSVDHINPVVPLSGFTNWDDIINRLFCEKEGLQVLCSPCHDKKTLKEREIAKSSRSPKV